MCAYCVIIRTLMPSAKACPECNHLMVGDTCDACYGQGVAMSSPLDNTKKFASRDEPTADGCSPADKVTGIGKKRMLQRVGEVAQWASVGSASNALALLKLDAAELNLLSPDEMFNTILEAAKKIPLRGVRDTVMIAIFDMEGMALIGEDEHAESLDNVIQVVYVQHGDAEISPKRLLEQQQQEQVDDDYERAANATNPTGGGDYFT